MESDTDRPFRCKLRKMVDFYAACVGLKVAGYFGKRCGWYTYVPDSKIFCKPIFLYGTLYGCERKGEAWECGWIVSGVVPP